MFRKTSRVCGWYTPDRYRSIDILFQATTIGSRYITVLLNLKLHLTEGTAIRTIPAERDSSVPPVARVDGNTNYA